MRWIGVDDARDEMKKMPRCQVHDTGAIEILVQKKLLEEDAEIQRDAVAAVVIAGIANIAVKENSRAN
jgi:hypothetical protein